MLLKKIWFIGSMLLSFTSQAQQVARAASCSIRVSPGTQVVVAGGITFTGTANWSDSGTTTLLANSIAGQADWLDSTATGVLINNIGKTVFKNTSNTQQVYGKTTFYDLSIKGNGINLRQSNEVKNILALDTGLVYFQTATDSIYVSNPAITAISSTSNYARSWVHGKLNRFTNIADPAQYFFPVGKIKSGDSLYAPVKLVKANTGTARYTAEYFPVMPPNQPSVNAGKLDHISYVEYWEIASDIPAATADDAIVHLSWRGFSRVSSDPLQRNNLVVAQYVYTPSVWWDVPTNWGGAANVSGADSLSGWVKSNSYINSFIPSEKYFTLGTLTPFNALPLKLIYFTATADGSKVRLNWNVEQEEDVATYEVEKSFTGNSFIKINTVASLKKPSWLYTDYDHSPASGWNYYRLKITDRLGKISYSGIRKVRFDKGLQMVSIFPNPTTDVLNIQLPSSYQSKTLLQLSTIEGKLISSLRPASSTVQLNVSNLPAATYLVTINTGDGNIETYRFVKK